MASASSATRRIECSMGPPESPPADNVVSVPARAAVACPINGSLPRLGRPSNRLQPGVRPQLAADLAGGPTVGHHDIGGEVVRAADQRRADAVRVDRHAGGLELADAVGGEAAGADDADVAEPVGVEL